MINENNDLYAFVHIPKTGGTSIVNHIEKNIPAKHRLKLYSRDIMNPNAPHKRYSFSRANNELHSFMKKLTLKRKNDLKIIYGHRVTKELEMYFPNRNIKYITFIRKPSLWIVSIYNHFRTEYYYADKNHKKHEKFNQVLKIDNKIPNFEKWLEQKCNKGDPLATWSQEYFLNLQKLKLKDFTFIGVDSHFLDDSLYFYSLMNMNKFFIRKNVSKKFYKLDSKKIKNKIYKKIPGDINIYKKAVKINMLFKKDNYNYHDRVKFTKLQRSVFLPYTQAIFEPVYTAKFLKRKLFN